MIKHRELVFKMSLEEKIKLVTSVKTGENCPVDKYSFPTFKLSAHPADLSAGNYATVFPSDKALASTWNPSIVRDVYSCIGNEAKANVPYAYFNTNGDVKKEGVSEDYYFTASFVENKIRGLNASGALVNFDNISECSERVLKECVKVVADRAVTAKPASVLVGSAAEAEKLPVDYRYEGSLYGVASTKEEVVKYLYLGCSLVFLESDFTDELVMYITGLTEKFVSSRREYEMGAITLEELDRRARCGEILDINAINAACDSFVGTLLQLRDNNPASVSGKRTALGDFHTAKFNEVLHDNMAYGAAVQSIVMLKNHDRALPLKEHTKIAVIGEYAKNSQYYTDFTKDNPTAVRLPFEVINGYGIDAVGYAHGYLRGESGRTDLHETACKLCRDVDYALVYLNCERGETALPQGQSELIDALILKGVKIIAVVCADGVIDLSFTDKCEAVLFSYRSGQAEATAVFDILTGKVSPSGKLVDTFPRDLADNYDGELPAYGAMETGDIRYPFGYGLTYTRFEYSNLKITENGISCIVANKGGRDGYATVQMYVSRDATGTTLSQKTLRGFEKVFIKSNDAALVEIPFDADTFRAYDLSSKKFIIEGGKYNIYIAENSCSVKLNGELTLEQHIFNSQTHKSEKVETNETMPVGFTASKEDKAIRREKAGLSFGLKLFLAIALMVYYNGMGGTLIFLNAINDNNLVFYIIIGVLLAIGNALAIVYLVIIAKKRKLQKYLHPNDVLSDMVEKVSNFNEVAKVNYTRPVNAPEEFVKEEVEEQNEETVEETPVEEVKAKTYENTFESESEETVFTKQVSFGELCANFREYALSQGVAVEPSSIRALFACISSSKLIILSCKNTDAQPALLRAISGYFGGVCVEANDEWQSAENLLWKQEDEKYLPSEFANAVNSACASHDKNCVALVSNVNFGNLNSYFSDFIKYSLFPSEAHTLVLNEELSLRLPDNMCYVLVPADGASTENLPAELAHAALQVDILATAAEASADEVEIKTVSRGDLAELVSGAREQHYLSEKIWKKIDEMVEAVCATERFAIGNKNVLCIEKYTSVLLECGGDEGEAFTSVFTAKVVPLLKTLKLYGKENGAKTIYGIVEKLFPDEDLSKIQKALLGA